MVSPDSRLGTVGIYIQYIYITQIVVLVSEPVRGRSRATELPCFPLLYICLLCDEVLLPWNFRSPGFDVRAPQGPPNVKKSIFFSYFGFKLKNFLSDCFLIWHAVADLRGGQGGSGPPHLSWVSIPSPGTLPPLTLFITNVKFRTWSS